MVSPPITSGQRKQISRFLADAVDDLDLDREDAQRVISHGGDLQTFVGEAIHGLALSPHFADQMVQARAYGYPRWYNGPRSIPDQIKMLSKEFPQLSLDSTIEFVRDALPGVSLPTGAEGWFAIPRWEKIAPSYGEAVSVALERLSSSRRLAYSPHRDFGAEHLRQLERSSEMFALLCNQQEGEVLILPAQFGARHRGLAGPIGKSRRVGHREFGLGMFAVACMLLTNPMRLLGYRDLWAGCPGDEFAGHGLSEFNHMPLFRFQNGLEVLTILPKGEESDFIGCVSAFLPLPVRK